MSTESEDPSSVRSIAVTAEDVVTAAETNRTSDRTAVLRITPPFSGRMRARLHVPQFDESTEGAIHVVPGDLLTSGAPAYPRPSETEDRLRADPDVEYTVDRHRERHEQTVEEWRDVIVDSIRSSITLSTPKNTHEVDVHVLGDW